MIQTGYQDYLRDEVEDLFNKLFGRIKDLTKDIIGDWLKKCHKDISKEPSLAEAILMNVRIANCTGFVAKAADEYGLALKEHLDELQRVRYIYFIKKIRGIHIKYNKEEEFEKAIGHISRFEDLRYLSVLRGTTDVPKLDVDNEALTKLLDSINSGTNLQGLH